jgi:hypothetical protein
LVDILHLPICEDCYSTAYCIQNKLRLNSYSLDWMYVSPYRVYQCIENEFANFFEPDNIEICGINKQRIIESKYTVFDTKYKLLVPHFIVNPKTDIPDMHNKFKKRNRKLLNQFEDKAPINFVYKSLNAFNKQRKHFTEYYSTEEQNEFGKHNMKIQFENIKQLLITKYQYNEADITIQYLKRTQGTNFIGIHKITRQSE